MKINFLLDYLLQKSKTILKGMFVNIVYRVLLSEVFHDHQHCNMEIYFCCDLTLPLKKRGE
jgi:hypothetical protein